MVTSREVQQAVNEAFVQALAAHQRDDLDTAQTLYLTILELDENHVNTLGNFASLCLTRGVYDDALILVSHALELDPTRAALHYTYGKILLHARLHAEALTAFENAIALEPQTAPYYSSHGMALFDLGRYAEAVASYDHAIKREPHSAEFHNNRGNALGHLGQIKEAIAAYDQAIAQDAAMADAYWNRALLQLMQGDFAQGLRGYEWRWKKPSFARDRRQLAKPLWLGDIPLAGKTIYIYPEQGLGDVIQFCRYVPLLEEKGAQVILEVPASLKPFLTSISPRTTVIAKGEAVPSYDLQCPIMSLPLAFGTTVDTIPQTVPYLNVDAAKQAEWNARLGSKTKPRIGLVWSGSATHVNDHNRSIPLAELAPLLRLPYEFHSLQKEIRPEDQATLGDVKDHQTELQDFTDTAALIEAMDLIISVDTSVAHVAGALAKPLWLLLPAVPDYRWLLHRDDTPWYPTARLFRQPAVRSWPSVIAQLAVQLPRHFGS